MIYLRCTTRRVQQTDGRVQSLLHHNCFMLQCGSFLATWRKPDLHFAPAVIIARLCFWPPVRAYRGPRFVRRQRLNVRTVARPLLDAKARPLNFEGRVSVPPDCVILNIGIPQKRLAVSRLGTGFTDRVTSFTAYYPIVDGDVTTQPRCLAVELVVAR